MVRGFLSIGACPPNETGDVATTQTIARGITALTFNLQDTNNLVRVPWPPLMEAMQALQAPYLLLYELPALFHRDTLPFFQFFSQGGNNTITDFGLPAHLAFFALILNIWQKYHAQASQNQE